MQKILRTLIVISLSAGFTGAMIGWLQHPISHSGFRSPVSSLAHFTPDPAALEFARGPNPYAVPTPPAPWLIPESTDPNVQPGAAPASTVLRSKAEPIVTKEGDAWKITFKK
jgi:hypothetical protein